MHCRSFPPAGRPRLKSGVCTSTICIATGRLNSTDCMTGQRDVPAWFTRALAAPVESRYVEVDGAPIHYLSWNAKDAHKPGLLFAHGFRAHARWWSFIAPFFMSRFRVVSMDFAGMGDSGARAHYEPVLFSRDIVGVIEHARL